MADEKRLVSRRQMLKWGAAGALGVLGSGLLKPGTWFTKTANASDKHEVHNALQEQRKHASAHGYDPGTTRTQGLEAAIQALTAFDYGKVGTRADGKTVREYEMVALDAEVEIAKGIKFPGWAHNG